MEEKELKINKEDHCKIEIKYFILPKIKDYNFITEKEKESLIEFGEKHRLTYWNDNQKDALYIDANRNIIPFVYAIGYTSDATLLLLDKEEIIDEY